MAEEALSLDRFISLRRVGAVTPSPDGTWLAVAVSRLDPEKTKYISDLWKVPLDGGAPSQLTWGRYSDRAPNFRQDGALGFLSGRPPREGKPEDGDDERSQVWLLPAQGGEPVPLTDEPLGVGSFRFAGDTLIVQADVLPGVPEEEQRKAFQAKKKGSSALHYSRGPIRYWDHWLPTEVSHLIRYSAEGRDRKDLTPFLVRSFPTDFFSWDVSKDGSILICTPSRPTEDRLSVNDLMMINTATGEATTILQGKSAPGHAESFGDVKISSNQKSVAYVRAEPSREKCGAIELWVLSLDTKETKQVSMQLDFTPHLVAFHKKDKAIVCGASYMGDTAIFSVDVASGATTRLTKGGCYEQVSLASHGQLVGVHHTYFHPPEPFLHSGSAKEDGKLVASLSGFTKEEGEALVQVQDLVVAAPDGGHVRGWVVAPKESKKHPVLLWIHGGPISAHHNGWHWRWNAMVMATRGYAVALPNPRGSTGYGQEFIEGIWKNQWGAACYRDLMAFTEALEKHPLCDEEKIAAMGGSFGGYMSNWIGVQTKRFKCIITHASLFHMEMFYGTTDGGVWFAQEMGTTPFEDKAAYDLYSPHRFMPQWKTPVLVIHGEKDYRVPISEALYLFEALQYYKVPSELLVFPDENHWILKPQNAKVWYQSVADFLAKYMYAIAETFHHLRRSLLRQ
jgi:dipeptidyl aminopeptidase/acylaminoacyl peptidase